MIKLLNGVEREVLAPIYEKEFDSYLPDEKQAHIIASVENGKIEGFLTIERLIRVGLISVNPKLRNTLKSAQVMKHLIKYAVESIPKGESVITIASDAKFESLFKRLGMREEEGKVFRLDF